MRHRLSALLTIFLVTAILAFTLAAGIADYGVIVKAGDWVEYQSNVTGVAPAKSNITGARLEVLSVEDTAIFVNVTTSYADGTVFAQQLILDESAGSLGDVLVVPANLAVGSQFYDRVQGNFTITGEEQRTVAGVQRTVVSSQKGATMYNWDKQTGVMVEADSVFEDFTLDTMMASTNMWQPKTSGLQPTAFYIATVALIVVAALVVVALLILVRRTKR
jgi:hypothetical protein